MCVHAVITIYIFIDCYIDKYISTRKIFILCPYVAKRDVYI